jgi:AcrR family transcriptional regulator
MSSTRSPDRAGAKPRLAASERRADILACACRAFSDGSYRGTTTAEIARLAGVTEPILYRHFDSKRALYLACLSETWTAVRALWDDALSSEPDPAEWLFVLGRAFRASPKRAVIQNLWVQAIAEASEDRAIRSYMQGHMREVQAYVADVIRRAQAAGGIPETRDAGAEAWIFLAISFLSAVSRFLGGLVEEDLDRIVSARRLWLSGRSG